MEIQFAVILPTYQRPKLALRALESITGQTYTHWRLIVVNDSPGTDYTEFETRVVSNSSITYLRNPENLGKNASINSAFDLLIQDNFVGYVIFLDDDDWLATDCLEQFVGAATHEIRWLVADRRSVDGSSFTQNRTGKIKIAYTHDYLLWRRFTGDATHCISFAETRDCRFPSSVRNAEEWFYFAQVDRKTNGFTYCAFTGTYSEGYRANGLTNAYETRRFRLLRWRALSRELTAKHLWTFNLGAYMTLRFAKKFVTS